MTTAKLFTSGRSQAVRLPKECRFAAGEKEVYARKLNGMVVLISKKNPWKPFLESLDQFKGTMQRDQPTDVDRRAGLG
jgi:antitoxin VapB